MPQRRPGDWATGRARDLLAVFLCSRTVSPILRPRPGVFRGHRGLFWSVCFFPLLRAVTHLSGFDRVRPSVDHSQPSDSPVRCDGARARPTTIVRWPVDNIAHWVSPAMWTNQRQWRVVSLIHAIFLRAVPCYCLFLGPGFLRRFTKARLHRAGRALNYQMKDKAGSFL